MLQLKFWNLSNIVSTTILQFVSTDLEQVVIFFKPTYTSVQLISLCPYSLIQKSLLSLLLSANFFNFIACEIREFEERERESMCACVYARTWLKNSHSYSHHLQIASSSQDLYYAADVALFASARLSYMIRLSLVGTDFSFSTGSVLCYPNQV